MANKGDEWFYLEWLAKKYGREKDIIRLRPRMVGESEKSAISRTVLKKSVFVTPTI